MLRLNLSALDAADTYVAYTENFLYVYMIFSRKHNVKNNHNFHYLTLNSSTEIKDTFLIE